MTEEIVQEYQSRGNLTNFLSKLSMPQVVGIILVVFILTSLYKSNVDPKYHIVAYLGFILIIAALYFKPDKRKRLLPRYVAAQIAQDELDRMVREGISMPYDSKCYVMAASQVKHKDDLITGEGGVPLSWAIGFYEKVHGSEYKKEGVIYIHPYDGIVTGINWLPTGYSGTETKDIKVVPVSVVAGTFKTTDYGGTPK